MINDFYEAKGEIEPSLYRSGTASVRLTTHPKEEGVFLRVLEIKTDEDGTSRIVLTKSDLKRLALIFLTEGMIDEP